MEEGDTISVASPMPTTSSNKLEEPHRKRSDRIVLAMLATTLSVRTKRARRVYAGEMLGTVYGQKGRK